MRNERTLRGCVSLFLFVSLVFSRLLLDSPSICRALTSFVFFLSHLYSVADTRSRKKEAREVHRRSEIAQKLTGIRAKLYNKKRYAEKAEMKRTCVTLSFALSVSLAVE